MNGPLWQLNHVTLVGNGRPRLDAVSLEIDAGVTAVVGPSGAGKTSLLNLLAGFERPDSGTIAAGDPPRSDRLPLFWVPQNFGLWPHLTAREHLEVVEGRGRDKGRETRDESRKERRPAPDFGSGLSSLDSGLLEQFDLAEKADACPHEMSQGERSRLAVARALASEAGVLVMDEPLVHVDLGRAGKYWSVVRRWVGDHGMSLVFSTHAPERVLSEAQQAVCLKDGRVAYRGSVEELYHRPNSQEVAEFLGPINWLEAEEAADWFHTNGEAHAPRLSICRPEQLSVRRCEESPLVVEASEFAGSLAEIELRNEATQQRRRFYHRPSGERFRAGERVVLKILSALMLCVLLTGCTASTDVEIPVTEVRTWSLPAKGLSVPQPRAVDVSPEDEIYVLDNAGRVLIFNPEGQLVRQWDMPESSVGNPEAVCVLRDGRIAVADTHYHRVVIFSPTGEVLRMWGSHGTGPGQFIYPVALAQDDRENLYVCEYGGNDRVQTFSTDGTFQLKFGGFGVGPGEFQQPSGIVWLDGRVYVADAFNNRIHVFSDDGRFLEILGSSGGGLDLQYPYDLAEDGEGDLFVVEYGAGRVTKLSLDGTLLGRFGTTGPGERQLSTPWGLAVTKDGRLYVADTGNRRIVALKLRLEG